MYFVYDYNVVDCKPEEEIDKYHNPLNKIICEETIVSAVRWCTTTVSVNIAFTGANWNTAAWALLEGLKSSSILMTL